jgi:uncharacterized protein (TIGR04255 family)
MEQPGYKRPPITEAVVEIRFQRPLDANEAVKVSAGFEAQYPIESIVRNVKVAVGMPPEREEIPVAAINQQVGHRRSSLDLTEILVVWPQAFVLSQLAPYPGWEAFHGRFVRDWTVWKRVVGFRKVSRIGVRYINRIDIPFHGQPSMEESEFLNIYPHLPEGFPPTNAYGVQAVLPMNEIGCKLVLNSSVVPSPLLHHASLLLDQDIARELDPPQRDEEIYDLLDHIRAEKNRVFEACVTARARELFQR